MASADDADDGILPRAGCRTGGHSGIQGAFKSRLGDDEALTRPLGLIKLSTANSDRLQPIMADSNPQVVVEVRKSAMRGYTTKYTTIDHPIQLNNDQNPRDHF